MISKFLDGQIDHLICGWNGGYFVTETEVLVQKFRELESSRQLQEDARLYPSVTIVK
jgi:hypothetical protein